ncbi:MAG: hypothetical protein ABIJ57_06250 [Pseudomonadota bacterium]
MIQGDHFQRVVSEGFEELALALGGVAASYDIPEEAIWDLARAVDLTWQRVKSGLSKSEIVTGLDDLPDSGCRHPAVTHLLQRLRFGRPDEGRGDRHG